MDVLAAKMCRMKFVQIIAYLRQPIVGEWIAGAGFLVIRGGVKIVRPRPYGHPQYGVAFFRGILFDAVMHAFVAAVKTFFFIEVNIKNVCSCNHENFPFYVLIFLQIFM